MQANKMKYYFECGYMILLFVLAWVGGV